MFYKENFLVSDVSQKIDEKMKKKNKFLFCFCLEKNVQYNLINSKSLGQEFYIKFSIVGIKDSH